MHMFTKSIICLPPKVNCEIGGAVRNLPGAVGKFGAKKVTVPGKKILYTPLAPRIRRKIKSVLFLVNLLC